MVAGEEQQQVGSPCWQECKEILTSTHLRGQDINGTEMNWAISPRPTLSL